MEDTFSIFGDTSSALLGMLVFMAATMLAFSVMASTRLRGAIKRRAAGISSVQVDGQSHSSRSLRGTSQRAAQRLVDYTNRHYSDENSKDMKVLRSRLVHAGIFDARGVAYFFLARTTLAIAFAVLVLMLAPIEGTMLWLLVGAGGVGGYLAPGLYLDRRIAARRAEYRSGFPDFMDLLVVCADAGLSMEASLDRVGRELGESYPALTANIHMTNLEIRAGRSLTEALEHFGDRMGLDEARSFSTLIQQSSELGSSITDALRVYSDDMRHKRLSRAEEKAYSLPTKLSLPMMVCIFPVLFVVILLPVVVRVFIAGF